MGDERVIGARTGRSDWPTVRRHLSIAAVLAAIVSVAPVLLVHRNAPPRLHVVADGFLGGWLRWDGWWYVMIAKHGYSYRPHHPSAVAFVPGYPLVVRTVAAELPGGTPLAAIVVTMLAGTCALVLFGRWCHRRLDGRSTVAATTLLALYPFAWFLYGAAYSDALYLALVLGAFLLLEDDRLVAAALVGAVATATRPTGITLVIGLVAVTLERRGCFRQRTLRTVGRRDVTIAASVTGLVVWCGWLAYRFGAPFAFIETEGAPGWDQAPGLHTWLKLGLVHRLASLPPPESTAIAVQAALFIVFLVAVPTVWRRLGAGYGIYTLAAVAVPTISTGDFLGVGRYLIPAFPVFAIAGTRLTTASPTWRRVTTTTSAALLGVGTALFAAGYLIA